MSLVIETSTPRNMPAPLGPMLGSARLDFGHVVQVNVYLKDLEHLGVVSRAFSDAVGPHGPAGTVVAVTDLPKAGALLTMSLTAIAPTVESRSW